MLLPYLHKDLIEAGCDEAGRGCLAGAVFAAAVILPADFRNEMLNDSKKLTEKQRYELRKVVEAEALAWAVGVVEPAEIDAINILNASFLAMHRCRPVEDASPALVGRRQPFYSLSRHSAYNGCEGRRKVSFHCGGFHFGKDVP